MRAGDCDGADAPSEDTGSIGSRKELAAELRRQLLMFERRTDARLKRASLAKKVGVSESSLFAYLNGTTLPPAVILDRLLDVLQVQATDRRRLTTGHERMNVSSGVSGLTPHELPADVQAFSGRAEQLGALDELLATRGRTAPAAVISALSGTAGVGKTALAIRWAHRVKNRFPDGQLYVDLRGFDAEQPMQPAEALDGLLRGLGVPGAEIPRTLPQRATRYRSLLAGRRMLILLDNAHSADQIRDLIPGAASCFALVTSRDSLAALVARNGAHRIEVDLLAPEEAVELLRMLLGTRVEAEPVAAASLAEHCAYLPLALRIAVEVALSRPNAALSDLVVELEHRHLDMLNAGDDRRTAIRAVFSWSYDHLPGNPARAFRLLGLYPGRTIERYAFAALTGNQPDRARQLLGTLTNAHLVREVRSGRFDMHDLLRIYARERCETEEPSAEQVAALDRLFNWYLHAAGQAADQLDPSRRRLPSQATGPAAFGPTVASQADASAWLDSEASNLIAAINRAAVHADGAHAWQLAHTLWRYFDIRGRLAEWTASHQLALTVPHCDEPWARAEMLHNLGNAHWRSGRNHEALSSYEEALPLRRSVRDRIGEANTCNNIGLVNAELGDYPQAIDWCTRAVDLYRELGQQWGLATSLNQLSICHLKLGHYQESIECASHAAARYEEIGHDRGAASAYGNLGRGHEESGNHREATIQYQRAQLLFQQIGDPNGEAGCLINIGTLHRLQGHPETAEAHQRQALTLATRIGDPPLQSEALNALGCTLTAMGSYEEAATHHRHALELSNQTGIRYQEACAHRGLAAALESLGQSESIHHQQQALEIFQAISSPEADDLHAVTAKLDQEK